MHCKSCGTQGGDEAFYESNRTKCKQCIRAAVIANRLAKIDYYRQFDNMRASQPHRVAARKEYATTDAYKASHKKAVVRYLGSHPKRRAAHVAIGNAIRDGRITKCPCMVCGAKKVEGHHPDYDRPLDVVWLCTTHHNEAHEIGRQHKEAA